MTTFIKADKFFYPYATKVGGYLTLTTDGKFGKHVESIPEDSQVIDYSGKYIAPGLVDTHVHGYAGADVMDNDKDGIIHTMSDALLSTGVTSFLPTALTASYEQLRDICQTIGEHSDEATGAKIQGIFFEGPYFTEKYKGAQNATYMRNPSFEEFQGWQEAAKGMLLKIAVAPEREGSADFISKVVASGTKVALGHSDATYEQAVRGAEAGASIWVHAYNGMRGLTHRELGMVGAVYEIPQTYAELICDGHHVVPKACDILMKQKGHDHVALITDCMRAGGEPDGDYMLGEYPVIVENGTARLKDGGNLAGSILKLNDGLKNVVDWGIASPEQAVMMATLIPAISVGIDDKCGRIKPGFDADFIVLEKDLALAATYLNGQLVYAV
ncbi:N-acetylglucosamine-6-phosphate deacetylase [Pseudolactococcus plantarum]|uniref:N-acetylglucosamine-6-phosphate deacetylase n=1 Tax=Pseudolactococcus plantarum TaxID=1365 RepID=A0A2A5RYD4_9LACT|nr:N-acetylglucosamine-6-phosphate deacetylase [Lactococcus plantarum]PCS06256.1 N-acetylglucosamine-6-phosphate deacetylase [Lactococcus plantarum]HCN74750.1 N-acetylglucosamine-6-phosphate deacetylase [Lactococcus sp.]